MLIRFALVIVRLATFFALAVSFTILMHRLRRLDRVGCGDGFDAGNEIGHLSLLPHHLAAAVRNRMTAWP